MYHAPCIEQRRSQNAEKVTHTNGGLLDQTTILFNYVPFQIGTSLTGKHLITEGANSFLYEQFPIVWKITFLSHYVTSLECSYFYYARE